MEHTVGFETAKRLKEAGWPQDEPIFVFNVDGSGPYPSADEPAIEDEDIAAPILTELLDVLPNPTHNMVNYEFKVKWGRMEWEFISGNPCDAAAELWLWCKEKGYLDAKADPDPSV